MLIANPIYDIVFKRLMEDHEIARGILERITETTIDQLDFAAKEHTLALDDGRLTFFRLDFIARIRQGDGTWKKVLIEVQKARLASDVERFRRYLGQQYCCTDEVTGPDGRVSRHTSLPIITIYFFGYTIEEGLPAAFMINREYLDLITHERLSEKSAVMESLTHNSYVVQIPKLQEGHRNEVEELLDIFRQNRFADASGHALEVCDEKPQSDLIKRILRRLTELAQTFEVQQRMALEDEAYLILEREVEEAKQGEQEARQLAKEERRLKEEAKQREEEARQLAEEERRQKEEAKRCEKALRALLREQGMTEAEIDSKLNKLKT